MDIGIPCLYSTDRKFRVLRNNTSVVQWGHNPNEADVSVIVEELVDGNWVEYRICYFISVAGACNWLSVNLERPVVMVRNALFSGELS